MSNELNFASFLNRTNPEAEATEAESVTDDALLETSEPTQEPIEPASEPIEQPEADSTQPEQAAPSQPARVTFEDVLRERGVPVDDEVDPVELYSLAAQRIEAGNQAISEVERLRAELEQVRANASTAAPAQATLNTQPQAEPSEPEAQAEARVRRFRELHRYDPQLESYVQRNENGLAVPMPEYGQYAVDAAQKINDYERSAREQAELILQNPAAILEDSQDLIKKLVEQEASRIVEDRVSAMRSEYDQAAQERAYAEAKQHEEQAKYEWHESNKTKLFKLTATGEIGTDIFDANKPAYTEFGRKYFNELRGLRARLPADTPELEVRNLAMEIAEAKYGHTQAAAAAPAPEQQRVMTPAEKKTLAAARQSIPNQNTPVAPAADQVRSSGRLSLASMALNNPANAEIVAGWR